MTKEFDPQTESDGDGPFAASTVTIEPRAFSACRCPQHTHEQYPCGCVFLTEHGGWLIAIECNRSHRWPNVPSRFFNAPSAVLIQVPAR